MKNKYLLAMLTSIIFSILLLGLTSCASTRELRKKQIRLNELIPQLELGMSYDDVRQRLPYTPDYTSKELLDNNVSRVVLTYKSITKRKWPKSNLPILYHLVFEDDILVLIDMNEDLERRRSNTFISASVGVTL